MCPSLALENPNDYRVCNPITPLGCPGVGCFTVVLFFIFWEWGGVGAEGPAFGGAGYNPKRKGEIREDGYLMRCIHHGVVSNVTLRRVLLTAGIGSTQASTRGLPHQELSETAAAGSQTSCTRTSTSKRLPSHCTAEPRGLEGSTAVAVSNITFANIRGTGRPRSWGSSTTGRWCRARGRAPLHEHCHRKHNHSAVTTQSAHRYSTVTAVKQREEVRGCWVLCVRRHPHCLPTLTTGGKTGP